MYGLLFLVGSNFGIIDDHVIAETLLIGKDLPYFIMESIGRYYPLNGQDIAIISKVSIAPSAFYFYNLFQFFFIIYLIVKLLTYLFGKNYKNLFYILILILILSPGFTTSWFRLLVPERGAVLFLSVFIYCYIYFQDRQSNSLLIMGVVAAAISLFYKETMFILVGGLSLYHFIFGYRILTIKQKIFDILLILTSIFWLLIYYSLVYINKGEAMYGEGVSGQFSSFLKQILSFSLSDPFALFLLPTLFVVRLYATIKNNERINPLYDGLIFASILYILAYLKLGIYNYYYLLPIYIYGIIAIVFFLLKKRYFSNIYIKIALILSIILFTFGSFPLGLHSISHYKNTPYNYQKSLSFLTDYINNSDNKLVIHIDGIKGSNNEPVVSVDKFLSYYGVDNDKYTLTYGEDYNNKDLIFITSSTMININDEYFSNLLINYKIIFMKKATFEVPDFSFRALIKSALIKYKPVYVNNHNITHKSDFYILKKIDDKND